MVAMPCRPWTRALPVVSGCLPAAAAKKFARVAGVFSAVNTCRSNAAFLPACFGIFACPCSLPAWLADILA